MTEIKILFAGLEETEMRGGTIILRGSIDASCMAAVKCADYQRELLPQASRANIILAIKNGEPLPPITLGMRGQAFVSRGDMFTLQDQVFCIDGQQRLRSAMDYAALRPQSTVRLGCTVHFDTTEAWEREQFHALNAYQKKMSPNVLLHNVRDQYRPVLMLYGLTHQTGFVLHDRVCWQQNKQRGHLLTALVCLRQVAHLHSHLAPGLSSSIKELLASLVGLEGRIGIQHMRDNVGSFWNLVDECYGVRKIEYSNCAPHLRGTFLSMLARVLANHANFWRVNGKQLFVEADVRRKIAQFDLRSEEVRRLCGSSGPAREILYQLMVRHINSGKRTRALVPWDETKGGKPRGRTSEAASAAAPV